MTPRQSGSEPGLKVGTGLTLPLDAVTETFAILAVRRSGKSNAAVVMAEEMYDAGLPWVAVDPKGDWWGVRAAGSGKKPGLAVVVFGGLHGDIPLEPASGRLVADLVAERHLTCVLDVSEMTKADQRRFLADFAEQLYRRNREPLHVFAEEADEYIPQRVTQGVTRLVGSWETLIKRGGFRGVGVTLISQRSASLNKDVLTQVETLIAMRTPSPQDRRAILEWVKQHETGESAVADLPSLASGEAWVFSPQFLDVLTKIKFRRRRTFDSGATPKVGGRPRPPATLAAVDLAEIQQAMSETIERVAAEDPTMLRRQVKQLQKQLAAARQEDPPAPIVERVEVPVINPGDLERLTETVTQLQNGFSEQQRQLATAQETAFDALTQLRAIQDALHSLNGRQHPAQAPVTPAVSAPHRRSPPIAPSPSAEPTNGDGRPDLRSGAVRMVEALGRMWPLRLTKSQWGTVARLKTSGGTWSTYLSDIRRAGFLDESAAGYQLTDAGFDYLGGRPDPLTAAELQDHYRRILRSGATKMLDALIEMYPDTVGREELGELTGLATTGGTFSTYLSDLNRNGLIEKSGTEYRATDVLMHGADQ